MQSLVISDDRLTPLARRVCTTLAWLSLAYGMLAFIGALYHIELLQNQTPWGTLIKANPALCLALCAGSIICSSSDALIRSTLFRNIAVALACVVATISGITLIEWTSGVDLGIDQLLVTEPPNTRGSAVPGRMAANASIAFLALGMGALLSRLEKFNKNNLDQLLAFIALAIGQLGLLGHTFSVPGLQQFWGGTPIAFTMSIMIIVISTSLFLARPDQGYARILVERGLGGIVVRRLLPWMAIFPFIGLVAGFEHWQATNLLMITLLTAVLLPVAIWRVGQTISVLDSHRAEALHTALAAKEEALEAAATKSRFAQLVSHEVRTPLSGVVSLTELLAQEPLEGETKEIATAAFDSSKRLMHVLNELLDLQKAEAKPIASRFYLREMLDEVIQAVKPEAQKKNLELQSLVGEGVPAQITGDHMRIRQVLINFAHNAIKFTASGSVTLRTSVEKADGNQLWLRLAVEDTGIGIESSQQQKLFQAFVQADPGISLRYGGTGLGLSISKQFAESMGGTLGLESAPGKGSKFWLVVPFTNEEREQAEQDMESTFTDMDRYKS